MPFRADELWRIKAELGYNVLSVGADPYIGHSLVFEQIVNQNIADTIETTTSTSVYAGETSGLTLADATGFVAGQRVVVGVGESAETVSVQSISGSTIVATFTRDHTGTYPVTVEGPITIAREALTRILGTKSELAKVFGEGSVKQVDEVQFYASGRTQFGGLGEQLAFWRDQLASALGVPNGWDSRSNSAAVVSVY